jgi:hypothetical protein
LSVFRDLLGPVAAARSHLRHERLTRQSSLRRGVTRQQVLRRVCSFMHFSRPLRGAPRRLRSASRRGCLPEAAARGARAHNELARLGHRHLAPLLRLRFGSEGFLSDPTVLVHSSRCVSRNLDVEDVALARLDFKYDPRRVGVDACGVLRPVSGSIHNRVFHRLRQCTHRRTMSPRHGDPFWVGVPAIGSIPVGKASTGHVGFV